MSGKTVVNIKVETILNQTLPGITVCFASYYSPHQIDDRNNPTIAKIKKNYHNLENVYRDLDKLFNNQTQERNNLDRKRDGLIMETAELMKKMSMVDFFKKITLPYHQNKIGIYIHGVPVSANHSDLKRGNGQYFVSYQGKPVESIASFFRGRSLFYSYKCFTFFSHLQKQWRDYKINPTKIEIHVDFQPEHAFERDSGGKYKPKTYHVAIHSQRNMPKLANDKEFFEFLYGSHKFFRFSKVETRLLGSGFDTNCFEYDLDHKFANYNMRSDCITTCLMGRLTCEGKQYFISQYPMRKEYYLTRENIKPIFPYCTNLQDDLNFDQAEAECILECRKDCKFNYYLTSLDEIHSRHLHPPYALLTVTHNSLPDILIQYLPEITLNAFICNFGGLLGLWLGLSILSIFNEFSRIFHKLIGSSPQFINNYYNQFILSSVNASSPPVFSRTTQLNRIREITGISP